MYQAHGLLALAGFYSLHALDRPELKDPAYTPTTQPALADPDGGSIFDRIRRRDLLVHLPYESFATSVGAFLAEAARDPDVVAIKQTLYRTWYPEDPAAGGEASVVQSLIQAGREGKQVAVLVELKARFDEEANITWARLLEEAGVHVVYGVAGLKTHAKIALVVRREGGRLVRYSHIGTGNYNPQTARLYDDLGLLTDDEDIGADLTELFNVLTGYSGRQQYRRLLVAPIHLRRQVIDLIRSQAATGRADRLEDEPPGGQRDHRRALRRLRRRGRDRPGGAGAVLAAPRGAGAVGPHPGPLPGGQVPGALPGDAVRRRAATRPTSSARPT